MALGCSSEENGAVDPGSSDAVTSDTDAATAETSPADTSEDAADTTIADTAVPDTRVDGTTADTSTVDAADAAKSDASASDGDVATADSIADVGSDVAAVSCLGRNYTAQNLGALVMTAASLPTQPSPSIVGATLTAQPSCASAITLPPTGANGGWRTEISVDGGTQKLLPRNTPLWISFDKATYLPLNTVELEFIDGASGTFHDKNLGMVPISAKSTVFPHWNDAKAAVIVEVNFTGCQTDGLMVSLDGHAESKVMYWGTNAPDQSLTTMNRQQARIVIDDITPGAPTTLTVTDTADGGTCTPSIIPSVNKFATGKIPLVAGEVTHVMLGAL